MAENVNIQLVIDTASSAKNLGQLKTSLKDLRKAFDEAEIGSENFYKLADALDETVERTRTLKNGVDNIKQFQAAAGVLTSTFQIATGAIATFGIENEQLEKTLVKVQSAMALSQGVSALIDNLGKARAASVALNATLLTNPFVLIGAAILGAAAAFAIFSSETDNSTEKQKKLNEELKSSAEQLKLLTALSEKETSSIKNRYSIEKARAKDSLQSSKLEVEEKKELLKVIGSEITQLNLLNQNIGLTKEEKEKLLILEVQYADALTNLTLAEIDYKKEIIKTNEDALEKRRKLIQDLNSLAKETLDNSIERLNFSDEIENQRFNNQIKKQVDYIQFLKDTNADKKVILEEELHLQTIILNELTDEREKSAKAGLIIEEDRINETFKLIQKNNTEILILENKISIEKQKLAKDSNNQTIKNNIVNLETEKSYAENFIKIEQTKLNRTLNINNQISEAEIKLTKLRLKQIEIVGTAINSKDLINKGKEQLNIFDSYIGSGKEINQVYREIIDSTGSLIVETGNQISLLEKRNDLTEEEKQQLTELKIIYENLIKLRGETQNKLNITAESNSKYWTQVAADIQKVGNLIVQTSNLITTAVEQNSERRTAALELEKNTAISILDEQLKSQLLSQEEYDAKRTVLEQEYAKKVKEEKKKAFVAQKAADIIQATINTALAVSRALAEGGISGPIFAAINGALGAAQIALIASQPTPEFKKGGVFEAANGGLVSGLGNGVSDDVNARLSNGESIMNARSTAMFGPLLSIMNQLGGGVSFNQNTKLTPNPIGTKNNKTEKQTQNLSVNVRISEKEITESQTKMKKIATRTTF